MTLIFNKNLEDLQRKIIVIEKAGNGHGSRTLENTELIDKETERGREEWFARLRLARCLKTDSFGNKTCEDVWDYYTVEEYNYYLKEALAVSPEDRYQDRKEMVWFHESNWSMRGLNADDGYGCGSHNNGGKCIPQCRYYNEDGRIEDIEVIEKFEKYKKPKIIEYHVDNKGRIVYHWPDSRQETNEQQEKEKVV
jgi:hypothetical protein